MSSGVRRATRGHTYHAVQAGGAGLAAYGLLALPGSDGSKTYNSGVANIPGRFINVVTNAKDVFLSSDPYWAPTRHAVYGGAAIWGIGKVAHKISFLRRLKVKVDRKIRVALV